MAQPIVQHTLPLTTAAIAALLLTAIAACGDSAAEVETGRCRVVAQEMLADYDSECTRSHSSTLDEQGRLHTAWVTPGRRGHYSVWSPSGLEVHEDVFTHLGDLDMQLVDGEPIAVDDRGRMTRGVPPVAMDDSPPGRPTDARRNMLASPDGTLHMMTEGGNDNTPGDRLVYSTYSDGRFESIVLEARADDADDMAMGPDGAPRLLYLDLNNRSVLYTPGENPVVLPGEYFHVAQQLTVGPDGTSYVLRWTEASIHIIAVSPDGDQRRINFGGGEPSRSQCPVHGQEGETCWVSHSLVSKGTFVHNGERPFVLGIRRDLQGRRTWVCDLDTPEEFDPCGWDGKHVDVTTRLVVAELDGVDELTFEAVQGGEVGFYTTIMALGRDASDVHVVLETEPEGPDSCRLSHLLLSCDPP